MSIILQLKCRLAYRTLESGIYPTSTKIKRYWYCIFGVCQNSQFRSATLKSNELYGEEFISNREILRELLGLLLKQEDWETIAAVAADSLKQEIRHQAVSDKISA